MLNELPHLAAPFQPDKERQTVEIIIDPTGDRTVSAKDSERQVPVVDVCGRTIGEVFSAGTRVRVSFLPGRIRVEVNPSDAAAAKRVSVLREKLLAGQPLSSGALCLGAGILDAAIKEGLAEAGVEARMAFAVEREGAYLDHASANNPAVLPETLTIEADLSEVPTEGLGRVDLLISGIPCTAASRQGRAKHRSMDPTLEHPEGHPEGVLFVDLIRFVVACTPAVVVLENVTLYRRTAGYAAVCAVLKRLGYHVSETELDASHWGCTEARQRLAMVAAPMPINLSALAPAAATPTPLGSILEAVREDDPRWMSTASMEERCAADAAAGNNFKLNLVGPEDTTIGVLGRGYSKRRRTEPQLRHPTRPGFSRKLTVQEHAAAKQVPGHLAAGLSDTIGHQVLGQGICYPPFVSLGRRIAESLLGWARGVVTATTPVVTSTQKRVVQTFSSTASEADEMPLFGWAA